MLLGTLGFPEVTCLWETKAGMLWRLGRQRGCLATRRLSPAPLWDGDANPGTSGRLSEPAPGGVPPLVSVVPSHGLQRLPQRASDRPLWVNRGFRTNVGEAGAARTRRPGPGPLLLAGVLAQATDLVRWRRVPPWVQ